MSAGSLISDGFRDDLRRLVQDGRQQTQQQRARDGYLGPLGQRPLPLYPIAFELKDDLVPGGNAVAYLMRADGSDADTNSPTITIYDAPNGDKRALGRDTKGTGGGAHGARGRAWPNVATGHREILVLQTLAKLLRVDYSGAAINASATFHPSALTVLDDGQSPVTNAGLSALTITNYSTGLPASAAGITCVHDGNGSYRVIDGPCP